MEILINLVYAIAANIYDEISAGSSSGAGNSQNP